MMTEPCGRCAGRGKIIGRKCGVCGGERIVTGAEEFNVTIVPGVFHGEAIKYTNMGD